MTNQKDTLWPYSKTAAIVAIPILSIVFAVLFSITQKYANWPDTGSRNLIISVAIVVSFIPLALVLLDYFRKHRALIDIKGVKIDFSRVDLSLPEVRRESFGLPDNIGVSGPIISDTSPMDIIRALEEATRNEIAVINIKKGNAWWVTRLLALSAGAVREGLPKAFVFVGKRENIENKFLGWGDPKEILKAILDARKEYRSRYQKAMRIAKQFLIYGANDLLPSSPTGFALHHDVVRYTYKPEFANLGEAVSEQILMDQLAISTNPDDKSLEDPPDRLTLSRLNELFSHCLYQNAIDLNLANEEQISRLLESQAPYLVLVRNGKYESMLKREDGERLIIRELFVQSQQDNLEK